MAAKLHYPVEFFFQRDAIHGFGTCCLYHRKRQTLSTKALNKIHDRINVVSMGLSRLLRNVSFEPPGAFPKFDIDEYGTPQSVAMSLRAAWRMPMGPVKNLIEWIEGGGGIVVPCDFETRKLDAVSLWPTKMPPLFFVNKHQPADRMRWTLAHELGHMVMHRIPPPSGEAEKQADAFAREFLLPARDIASEMEDMSLGKALRLKPKWRVSMQALINCAREHGTITPRKHQWLFTQISQLGYRKSEPDPIPPEHPTLLKKMIDVHVYHLKYPKIDIARIAFCTTCEQFSRRFPVDDDAHPLRVVG
jgi:Zn-dependent peptidase ImmA (M78 family)